VKIFMPAGATEPVYAPYKEFVPPDTTALSIWLRNRHSDKWRDRIEHSGPFGGPIALSVERKLEWESLSEAQIEAIELFAQEAKERRDAAQRTIEHRSEEKE
jgi:hypothetical protein